MAAIDETQHDDEATLAKLGYRQSLDRAWSGFSNFAISFTIISVLAGCFTTYAFAWNGGGPIAISWGWPIICGLILFVAVSMSELVSKYPTAGGIYYWASDLGGKTWGWFTGWFNLIGLVGVTASVVYASAQFAYYLLSLYGLDLGFVNFGDDAHVLSETFWLFALFLAIHSLVNIYSSPLVAMFNNISVWWHVLGVAIIIAILIIVPDQHQSIDFVFTDTINNTGLFDGSTSGLGFWFYVLPLGFLLTMYTQTGYDASAHISEETRGAALGAAKGVWRSVFWAGAIGWIVLLAITFAATKVG
ncbi:MAG: amino acid permease, partial [Thermoleophilia bacterium]|nr:amino acid permease [Thermoleophilia bacterium]